MVRKELYCERFRGVGIMNRKILFYGVLSFFIFVACVPESFAATTQKQTQEQTDKCSFYDPFYVLEQEIDNFFGYKDLGRVERLSMKLDIAESKGGNLTILAELPGINAKDISISILGNILKIEGEKKVEFDENKENTKIRERVYGSFARAINLPFEPEVEKITAIFINGVLKIEIPKSGKISEAKKIQIKHNTIL